MENKKGFMFMKKKVDIKTITLVGLLSGVAFLLSYVTPPTPMFPRFLELELSDIPALVALLSRGIYAAIFVELVKNVLGLMQPVGGGIGELANFVVGCCYLIPLGLVYKKYKSNKGFSIGAIFGTISMVVFAGIINYYFFIPVYCSIMGMEIQSVVDMSAAVIPAVTDFKLLIIYAILPFNFMKAVMISIVGYIVYKALKPHIKFL